jgi:hypothetical protein
MWESWELEYEYREQVEVSLKFTRKVNLEATIICIKKY